MEASLHRTQASRCQNAIQGFYTDCLRAKLIQEYTDAEIPPEHVWIQSATTADLEYLVATTNFADQVVALDFADDRLLLKTKRSWMIFWQSAQRLWHRQCGSSSSRIPRQAQKESRI
jgi:hypothetical protein